MPGSVSHSERVYAAQSTAPRFTALSHAGGNGAAASVAGSPLLLEELLLELDEVSPPPLLLELDEDDVARLPESRTKSSSSSPRAAASGTSSKLAMNVHPATRTSAPAQTKGRGASSGLRTALAARGVEGRRARPRAFRVAEARIGHATDLRCLVLRLERPEMQWIRDVRRSRDEADVAPAVPAVPVLAVCTLPGRGRGRRRRAIGAAHGATAYAGRLARAVALDEVRDRDPRRERQVARADRTRRAVAVDAARSIPAAHAGGYAFGSTGRHRACCRCCSSTRCSR